MPSGFQIEVINTRERAVSNDITRLQAFSGAELAHILYEMVGKYNASDDMTPATETSPVAGATPPFNAVLNGLRCYPVNGTLDLLVTDGTILIDNSGAGVDDAPLYYCKDPGLAAGTLVLTPAPGAIRFDVLECRVLDTILETDNRDVFNIVTGLFAPVALTKVMAGRLEYRIRLGTPGAGFPGLVAGWVPLAVFNVSAAAASWDDVDIWDVRNLVSEFYTAPFKNQTSFANVEFSHMTAEETVAGAPYDIQLSGRVLGHLKHFRIDGWCSNYPTAFPVVDISTGTTNWAPGVVFAASKPWYVYLAFPFGLPGWRKYTNAAFSPRTPYGLRGIPIVTSRYPLPNHTPSAPLPLPVVGIGAGTTSDAVCVHSGMCNAATAIRGSASDGHLILNKEHATYNATVSDPLVGGYSDYTLIDGTDIPADAKSVFLRFYLELDSAGAPGVQLPLVLAPYLELQNAAATRILWIQHAPQITAVLPAASTSTSWEFGIEVPLVYRTPTTPVTHRFRVVWGVIVGHVFNAIHYDQFEIMGWRIGE